MAISRNRFGPTNSQWNVNDTLNNKTTPRPAADSKVGKKKKKGLKKKRNEKTNVWWPWANYEEWLANHKQDQPSKTSDSLELSKDKKKHNKKRGEKKRKRKQNKNRKNRKVKGPTKEKSSNGTSYFKTETPNLMNKPTTIAPEASSKQIHHYKTNDRKRQKDHIVDKYLPNNNLANHPSQNLKLKESLNSGHTDGVIKIDKEIDIVQNIAPAQPNNNVEYMTRAKDKSMSLNKILEYTKLNRSKISEKDHDNEIRHFYNWMPSWKGSLMKISHRNFSSDVNECLLRNGHGPCQGECYNQWGSYKCGCATVAGTELATDGRSCRPVDSCATANCTHMCINTRSGAFCTCPQGYVLAQDWKTCEDVDECLQPELQDTKCNNGCSNSIGSYTCL
ncbi:hypothetical protein AAG570_012112 [Ranatra chinensis]|uniref:EGF-like domain-containing protein n=1 Tax=Ranatra chinensis TaxID=642074 RepID=A0ABD0YHV6_9HEMI